MRLIQYLLILLTAFLGPNYTATPAPETNRVVTQIEVTVVRNDETTNHLYTDDQQMEAILTYLRMTLPRGAMQYEPDSFRSDSYTFTVHFSDGSQTIYRQIYHDFLQKNTGRWQKIDPKAGLLFPPL